MEKVLKQILGELQKTNHRLDHLEEGQEQLQSGQDRLQTAQDRLQTTQEQLQLGQDPLQTAQDKLQTGQDLLQTSQDKLQSGQDQLKDHLINGLGRYFEQIEKHINAKFYELKDTLDDQQRIIDTLAIRSVKHESEIKDLKHTIKNQ